MAMHDTAAGLWENSSPATAAPSSIPPDTRSRLAPVWPLLASLRRRRWLQFASRRTVASAIALLPLLALLVVTIRSAWLPQSADPTALAIVGFAVVAAAGWIVLHRLRWFDAARLADHKSGGKDRISTALELAAAGRTDDWAQLQAVDAVAWLDRVQTQRVLPWQLPPHWGWALAATAVLVVSLFAPLPWISTTRVTAADALKPKLPVGVPHLQTVADLLAKDDLELIAEDVKLLEDIEEQLEDGPTRKWLRKVRKTLDAVATGKLDKRDALGKLAELEKQRPAAATRSGSNDTEERESPQADSGKSGKNSASQHSQSKPSAAKSGAKSAQKGASQSSSEQEAARDKAVRSKIGDALKESLKDAPKSPERDELKKAAEKKDLDAISKWVEKMAQRDWSDKQMEKWIKVAEKFADKLGDRKIDKKFDKIRKQIQRLQRKRERQGGLNSSDRRRLRSARRNADSLRRKHGDTKAARFQLQRLQRTTKKAAQQMRRQHSRLKQKQQPKRASDEARRARKKRQRSFEQSMNRAAGQMRRMSQQQKQRQARRIGESRVQQAKQSIGRAGRQSASRKDFEQRARQQRQQRQQQRKGKQKGQGREGKQKQAKQGQRSGAQQRAKAKNPASGKSGRGQGREQRAKFRLGGSDMPDDPRMQMMRDSGKRQSLTQMKRGGGEAPGQANGADPSGGKSQRMGVARTERVKGIDNEGPTVKQTFVEAAKKGFARASWAKVYADYSEVAESMIARQGLPVGRKSLVRRYFELIRPRQPVESK